MTSEVIDAPRRPWLGGVMTTHEVVRISRYDRTLRSVMWMDAFLSVAMVVVCVIAAPVVATLGMPHQVVTAVGVAAIVSAVLLAAFGAITAVALMLRMSAGDFSLPPQLRVPLPRGMNPIAEWEQQLSAARR